MSCYRVTFSGQIYGVTCQNVIAFDNPDGALSMDAAAVDLRDTWLEQLRLCQVNEFTWINIHIADADDPTVPTYNLAVTKVGGIIVSGQQSVLNSSYVLRIYTGYGGSKGRGRIFVPGCQQGAGYTAGRVSTTQQTLWAPKITALKAAYVGGARTSVLALSVKARGNGTTVHRATDLQLRVIAGSQRRRCLDVGV